MAENTLNVRKAYEALARILGERANVKITVVAIKEKEENTEDKTA